VLRHATENGELIPTLLQFDEEEVENAAEEKLKREKPKAGGTTSQPGNTEESVIAGNRLCLPSAAIDLRVSFLTCRLIFGTGGCYDTRFPSTGVNPRRL